MIAFHILTASESVNDCITVDDTPEDTKRGNSVACSLFSAQPIQVIGDGNRIKQCRNRRSSNIMLRVRHHGTYPRTNGNICIQVLELINVAALKAAVHRLNYRADHQRKEGQKKDA